MRFNWLKSFINTLIGRVEGSNPDWVTHKVYPAEGTPGDDYAGVSLLDEEGNSSYKTPVGLSLRTYPAFRSGVIGLKHLGGAEYTVGIEGVGSDGEEYVTSVIVNAGSDFTDTAQSIVDAINADSSASEVVEATLFDEEEHMFDSERFGVDGAVRLRGKSSENWVLSLSSDGPDIVGAVDPSSAEAKIWLSGSSAETELSFWALSFEGAFSVDTDGFTERFNTAGYSRMEISVDVDDVDDANNVYVKSLYAVVGPGVK